MRRCHRGPLEVVECHVEGHPQRSDAARGLGEDEAALDRRQGGDPQRVGVGAGGDEAGAGEPPDGVSDRLLPGAEGGVEHLPGLLIGVGQLGRQGSERTSARAAPRALDGDDEVEPPPNPVPVGDAGERLAVRLEDRSNLQPDHRVHQAEPVAEVMVELALARARRREHLVDAGRRHPVAGHQVGRDLQDVGTGRPASGGERKIVHCQTTLPRDWTGCSQDAPGMIAGASGRST